LTGQDDDGLWRIAHSQFAVHRVHCVKQVLYMFCSAITTEIYKPMIRINFLTEMGMASAHGWPKITASNRQSKLAVVIRKQ